MCKYDNDSILYRTCTSTGKYPALLISTYQRISELLIMLISSSSSYGKNDNYLLLTDIYLLVVYLSKIHTSTIKLTLGRCLAYLLMRFRVLPHSQFFPSLLFFKEFLKFDLLSHNIGLWELILTYKNVNSIFKRQKSCHSQIIYKRMKLYKTKLNKSRWIFKFPSCDRSKTSCIQVIMNCVLGNLVHLK